MASTKAYTSQIAVMTMIALALGQDSISNRELRESIIDDLVVLPGTGFLPVVRQASETLEP